MLKTLFITKILFQIIHTILILIAFTYIIAVNLNSLSQILGVHIVSLKNKGYHCRMSQTYHIHVAATSENILPLQYIIIQTLQNVRAYVSELIWLL